MSGLNQQAPDPLELLRASDRRPRIEIWRERLASQGLETLRSTATRGAFSLLLLVLIVGTGWRLFVATEPPVEDSIPLAQPLESAAAPTSVAVDATAGQAVDPTAASAATTVVVHVAGAVSSPGIVVGDSTWRVDDALRAAGGTVATADLDRINLAALLTDGQRVFVPHIDEEVPSVIDGDVGGGPAGGAADEIVNLNTSAAEQLESLPGVGPATAAAIISHREEYGAFASVDALVAVSGIGPATVESLRDYVRV